MAVRPIVVAVILALLVSIAPVPPSTAAQEAPAPPGIVYVFAAGSELGENERVIDVIGLEGGVVIVSIDDERNITIVRTLWDGDKGFSVAGPVTVPGDSVSKILLDPEISGTGPVLVLVTWCGVRGSHILSLIDLVNGALIAEENLKSLAGAGEKTVLSLRRLVYIEGLDLLVVPERMGKAVYAIDLASLSHAWSASIDPPGFLSHLLAVEGMVYLYYTIMIGDAVNVTLVSINASMGEVEGIEAILENHYKGEGFAVLTTGRYTVMITRYANGTGTIIVHDPARGTLSRASVELRSMPDYMPSASPDGRYIAAAGMYSTSAGLTYDVIVIDAVAPGVVARLSVGYIDRIGWSPDSRLLYVSEERSLYSGLAHVIDIVNGAVYGPFNITPANYAVTFGNGTIYIGTTEGRGRDKPTVTVYNVTDHGLEKIAESVVFDVAKEHWLVPLGSDTQGPLYVIMEVPIGDFEQAIVAYKLQPAETVAAVALEKLFVYVANPTDPGPLKYSTSVEKQVGGIALRANVSFNIWSGYIIVVYEEDGEWITVHTYGALIVTEPGEATVNANTTGKAVLNIALGDSSLWIVEAPLYDPNATVNVIGYVEEVDTFKSKGILGIFIKAAPGEARVSLPGDVVAVFSVNYYEPEASLFSSPARVVEELLSLDVDIYPDEQPEEDNAEEEQSHAGGDEAEATETRDEGGADTEKPEEETVDEREQQGEQGGGARTAVLVAVAALVIVAGAILVLRRR